MEMLTQKGLVSLNPKDVKASDGEKQAVNAKAETAQVGDEFMVQPEDVEKSL